MVLSFSSIFLVILGILAINAEVYFKEEFSSGCEESPSILYNKTYIFL